MRKIDLLGDLFSIGGSGGGGGENVDVTVKFMDGEDLYQLSSVKTGCGVYAPTVNPTPPAGYSFRGWFDGETHQQFGLDYKTPIVYSEDKVLNAHFLTDYSGELYSHYEIDRTEYPYVYAEFWSTSSLRLVFAKNWTQYSDSITLSGGVGVLQTDNVPSWSKQYGNIPDVINCIKATIQKSDLESLDYNMGNAGGGYAYTNFDCTISALQHYRI